MAVPVSSMPGGGNLTFACSVAAYGVVEVPMADLPALRERPGCWSPRPLPPRLLRYADEQTVVAMAAVLQAIESGPLRDACLDDWGVLAAPQFLGRAVGAATFTKFKQSSLAAVSPHIIPQNSLHSVSGTISIALGMHGPNFGIGGGPEALAEGLTAGLTFLEHGSAPGLWLLLTQWTPEPVPDTAGALADNLVCWGVALALVRGAEGDCTLRLADGPSVCRDRPASPLQHLPLAPGKPQKPQKPLRANAEPVPGLRAGEAATLQRKPAPGGVDRQEIPQSGAKLSRPDPGGEYGADARGRQVRVPPGVQVLDLRHMVDPAGHHAGDCRSGANDSHPRAHDRRIE